MLCIISSAGALYEPSCRAVVEKEAAVADRRSCTFFNLVLLTVVFSILYGVVLVLEVRCCESPRLLFPQVVSENMVKGFYYMRTYTSFETQNER